MLQGEEAIRAALQVYTDEIEVTLEQCLAARILPPNLREAMEYAVLGGGKRLRPLLTVLSCEAAGSAWDRSLPAAAATELIHAFSLVHDDLPAMDDDDLRRGRPTVHVKYGEGMAILAGDALQALAFELLCDDAYTPEQSAGLIRELAGATSQMIAGQVYDTLGGLDQGLDARQRVEAIHRCKTGALIRAACRMGAIAGDADAGTLERISRYGAAVGLMFQVVDDLLDVTQSTEHTGKATGKDMTAGKITFPGQLGLDATRAEIRRLHAEARTAVEPLGGDGARLLDLCDYLAVRTK